LSLNVGVLQTVFRFQFRFPLLRCGHHCHSTRHQCFRWLLG
jgi:hypothetical protein